MENHMDRASSHTVPAGLRLAAIALAVAAGLSACKGGADAAPPAKPDEAKVDATPVAVAAVGRRAIAARDTGTAALAPPAAAQVVAKTPRGALQALAEEGR